MELIKSRSNKFVKYCKALGLARNRRKEGRFLVEGARLTEDAVALDGRVEKIIVTPHASTDARISGVVSSAAEKGIETVWVADRVIDYISETDSNQGIMAIVKPVEFTEDDLENGQLKFIIVAHLLQDPGNLGTIVRVAEAAGAGGVVTTPGTVDFYNAKALRSTMGSIFREPTVRIASLDNFVEKFRAKGYQVIAATVSAKRRYFDLNMKRPTVLLVGQEAAGLPEEACRLCDKQVTVPMATMMDSMNVAMATGIITYEAVRQTMLKK